jgi:hypothetical protein
MKKAVVQVMFEQKKTPNGITLLQIKHLLINNTEFINKLAICDSWKCLYDAVLYIIKNNGYYVKSWSEFGSVWYDIAWYDHVNDVFNRMPYPKKVETA